MMMRKKQLFVVFIIMLFLTIPLSEPIQSTQVKEQFLSFADLATQENKLLTSGDPIQIHVYVHDIEGNLNRIVKTMSKNSYTQFLQQISQVQQGALNLIDVLQQKMQIMKSYDLVPSDITLNTIIDTNTIDTLEFLSLNLTETTHFQSNFAPLFILGMGFGLGFGYRRLPVFPHLAGNLFSIGFIGYGGVLCLDIQDRAIYYQYTDFFPYLIHIISGFIGIMMFAYDNIFPSENGLPFTFYSNFIGIGMAGVAVGFEFPPT
jgi:hypothetical protein